MLLFVSSSSSRADTPVSEWDVDRQRRELRDPAITDGIGQFGAIQAVALSVGVEVIPVNVRDAGDIERSVTAFARSSNGGLIVTGSALAQVHGDLIITLVARHKLPAVYFERYFIPRGGLL
jgi:putative tryptophan/tyrosine transport system substrate-binding protein